VLIATDNCTYEPMNVKQINKNELHTHCCMTIEKDRYSFFLFIFFFIFFFFTKEGSQKIGNLISGFSLFGWMERVCMSGGTRKTKKRRVHREWVKTPKSHCFETIDPLPSATYKTQVDHLVRVES
jgi:hypothetical protein